MSLLSRLKGISAQDRRMIEEIEAMLGPEPEEMGFMKNLFWGRFREDLVFPYPEESKEEREKCDALLAELEAYLKNEHPSILIDQEQYIPDWVLERLFEMGVMGLTIPEEYGGLGLGVTSYNRVLELIGRYCASTAVVVSATSRSAARPSCCSGPRSRSGNICRSSPGRNWPPSVSRSRTWARMQPASRPAAS